MYCSLSIEFHCFTLWLLVLSECFREGMGLLKEKTSSHNLWKVYRQLMGKKSRETNSDIEKVISKNGMLTDTLCISNEFNNYFCKIGENLSKSIPKNENCRKYLINDYQRFYVSLSNY